MTQSRSQSTQLAAPSLQPPSYAAVPLLLVLVALLGLGIPISFAGAAALPAVTPAPPKIPAAPAAANETTASATIPAAAPTPPGVGLPAALVALLRSAEGPFLANEVFSVVPSEPLTPVEEAVPAPEWYAVTRGRFVGIVDQFALSTVAITGVAHGACKAYTTQALALDAFNRALTWGGVQIA